MRQGKKNWSKVFEEKQKRIKAVICTSRNAYEVIHLLKKDIFYWKTIAQAMKSKRLRYSKTVMIARQNGEQHENHQRKIMEKHNKCKLWYKDLNMEEKVLKNML